MSKKNIGIFSWYKSTNYGTCLQAYALNQFLKNHNYNAYFVEGIKYYYGLHNPLETIFAVFKKYINKFKKHPNSEYKFEDINKDLQVKYIQRKLKNTKFSETKMIIHTNKSRTEYNQMLENTNVFITGSDQIWNPDYVSPNSLLAFAKNNKKIAYASSIGVDRIPFFKRGMYKKYLSRFYKIGVREKTAEIELSKLLNKEVTTVLDPTFLLNRNDWAKIIDKDKCEILPKNKYIFCYFIGKNREWEKQIKEYAEKNGYEVFCALSESYIMPDVGISKPELGVEEFINYLMHADIVATDSFHAVALSVNFNKNFAVFKRFKDTDKKSQNSRIIDILSTFKLSNQLVDGDNTIDKVLVKCINYSETNNILNEFKSISEKFLIDAIEEG